jgi:hypothetical protein
MCVGCHLNGSVVGAENISSVLDKRNSGPSGVGVSLRKA